MERMDFVRRRQLGRSGPPAVESTLYCTRDRLSRFATLPTISEQSIVLGMNMSDMRGNRQCDGEWIELLGGGRPPDSAAVLLASMLRDALRFRPGAAREHDEHPLDELGDEAHVCTLPLMTSAFPRYPAQILITEAFPFSVFKRPLLHQEALPLIPPPRPAEPDDDSAQGRMLATTPSEGCVAPREECEMIEVGALETQWLALLHPEKAALRELSLTRGTPGGLDDVEYDDLLGFLRPFLGGHLLPSQ